jgi:hypothetical protein
MIQGTSDEGLMYAMLSECDRKGGNAIAREEQCKIYESIGGKNGMQEQSATHKHLLGLSARRSELTGLKWQYAISLVAGKCGQPLTDMRFSMMAGRRQGRNESGRDDSGTTHIVDK